MSDNFILQSSDTLRPEPYNNSSINLFLIPSGVLISIILNISSISSLLKYLGNLFLSLEA